MKQFATMILLAVLLAVVVRGASMSAVSVPAATQPATAPAAPPAAAGIRIGSKAFTESVVLGELVTQLTRAAGTPAEHRRQLGGSPVLWKALLAGEVDAYPEYTGTITQELLKGEPLVDLAAMRHSLAERGIGISAPLGFNDTYALGVTAANADRFGLKSIGDLQKHLQLRVGVSNEFLERKDGWPAVRARYALPQTATGLDHDLAYRAVSSGSTDVIDLYSTDAEIRFYNLRVLDDDKKLFPAYDAVILYRLDTAERSPALRDAIGQLEGKIDESRMIAMNARAKLDRVSEEQVAHDFAADVLETKTEARPMSRLEQLGWRTLEHILLVTVSLAASIAVAIPLGVAAFAFPRVGRFILGTVAAIYTIPALALLVFMIPIPGLGIGTRPALAALFLYGLLPIVRNTHAGLAGVPASLRESARVLGLPPSARLLQIELPLASPSILAGIQTAAVLNVGTATIGALIGAGGYGQFILTGVRRDDTALILLGAVPAAAMALVIQAGFGLLGQRIVPRGLRMKART